MKSKNSNQKKYQIKDEEDNIVNEPEAIYFTIPKSVNASPLQSNGNFINRSVALLGMMDADVFAGIRSNTDFIPVIREGVPKIALDNLMEVMGMGSSEISSIIRTSDRTLRRYTSKQRLNAEQSERIIELAKLYGRGEEVFGSLNAFKEWMDSKVIALGNKKPKEFLDTSLGIDMLMDELGRIEHGIFA